MGYPKTHPDLSVKNGPKLKISSFAAHTKHELSSSHLRGFIVIIHVHGGVRGDLGTNFQLKLGFCPNRISWLICQQGESLEWQRVLSLFSRSLCSSCFLFLILASLRIELRPFLGSDPWLCSLIVVNLTRSPLASTSFPIFFSALPRFRTPELNVGS